jgi:site-specific recombinase XerD
VSIADDGQHISIRLKHVPPKLRVQRLSKITTSSLNDLYGPLPEEGKGPSVVEKLHRTVRGAFAYAESEGAMVGNPAQRARPPRYSRRSTSAKTLRRAGTVCSVTSTAMTVLSGNHTSKS